MSVLDREALEASPLADLHAIAGELGLDGFRRLRKADLIDRIVAGQNGEIASPDEAAPDEADAAPVKADADERPARRRGGRGRGRSRSADDGDTAESEAEAESESDAVKPSRATEPDADADRSASRGRRGPRRPRGEDRERGEDRGRGEGRGEGRGRDRDRADNGAAAPDRVAEGTVELLGNGSGFVRVAPPEPSDDDVYISAAQIRRCELVSGDVVAGPVRPPRRSERYPSLVRVDTINGSPADEVAGEGTRYDDLPVAYPADRLALDAEDPTLKAIEWLTPFGKGSRVTIAGAARSGKTEALRRIAAALAGREDLTVAVALVGVRPEEVALWHEGPAEVAASAPLGASHDAQAQVVDTAVERARRVAARGGDAVLLIDALDGVPPLTARKALAAARNLVDSGSLTLIATAPHPLGGETTVVTLDARLAQAGRFPALDLAASGTVRPDLLVGEAGAEAIAKARADALG